MRNYGVPYMGSKNKIVKWISEYLPKADNFYDLFCGGGAVTHHEGLTNKYKNIFINDIMPYQAELVAKVLTGNLHIDKTKWISREDFFKHKDTDPVIRCCWSFGNDGRTYLYSKKIEPYKKALHCFYLHNDKSLLDELGINIQFNPNLPLETKKTAFRKEIRSLFKDHKLNTYLQLQSLESLQRLQSLERLERLQSLQHSQQSYEQITIKPNSLIYCDIPYKNTKKYGKQKFDYKKFYDWVRKQKELVIISEKTMPDDFIIIAEKEYRYTLCATNNNSRIKERLFIPKHQRELYEEMMKRTEKPKQLPLYT